MLQLTDPICAHQKLSESRCSPLRQTIAGRSMPATRWMAGLTSPSQSMVAETLLFELQNGQLKATSSLGRCFFGGGLDDFLFPIRLAGSSHQTACKAMHCRLRSSQLVFATIIEAA